MKQILLQWALVPSETTLWVCHCGSNLVVFCYGLKVVARCADSGASWRGLCTGQDQVLPMIDPGLSGKVTNNLQLIAACAGPVMYERGHTEN